MSTRSRIAFVNKDGSVKSVYCHSDGYLSWNGKMLYNHYDSPERAEALVDLGDLSVIHPKIEGGKGHSFSTPDKDVTIAYGRDRGEDENEVAPQVDPSVEAFMDEFRDSIFIEFLYVYQNGGWWATANGRNARLEKLGDLLAQERSVTK